MVVFVLDKNKQPLFPCSEKRARQLLEKDQAEPYRQMPFVIRLKEYEAQPQAGLRLKIDPGSKITGLALLDRDRVVWLGEIHHRTNIANSLETRRSLRRGRRNRKTRYRAARFDNRSRQKGWLTPSTRARVDELISAVKKLMRLAPISEISMELNKFDTQKMDNPEIKGVEYQQGELWGYEIRAYVQEKFKHRCAYCGCTDFESHDIKFELDHIQPRSRGGSNRVSNLVYACKSCNEEKGNMTAEEFGHPEVMAQAKAPMKDAAATNSTRRALYRRLEELGLPIETGTGGRTKFNRAKLNLPKAHYIDAVCVGSSTPEKISKLPTYFDVWKAKGRGSRQRRDEDKYGFPRLKDPNRPRPRYKTEEKILCYSPKTLHKRIKGFSTGDIVKDSRTGAISRISSCRLVGNFTLSGGISVTPKKLKSVQRNNGWDYYKEKLDTKSK